jgi:hypothetical protein
MTLDELRKFMRAYREDADRTASATKQSNLVWDLLCDLYRKFDEPNRALANRVIGEWVLSDDETLRYDALVLVDQFNIYSLQPLLEQLLRRLEKSNAPGASSEAETVTRILGKLTGMKIMT